MFEENKIVNCTANIRAIAGIVKDLVPNLELHREHYRRKKMLIYWFEDNFDTIMTALRGKTITLILDTGLVKLTF